MDMWDTAMKLCSFFLQLSAGVLKDVATAI